MERKMNKKVTITVGLLVLIALLAATICGIWFNRESNDTLAYTLNANVVNAKIGNHGVGEVSEQISPDDPNAETKVRERHGVGSNYQVVWIDSEAKLKENLETASGAKANAGANKILIFSNKVDWRQDVINEDVGTQKFVGILDGNGYDLNIYFTAPAENGGTAKGSNGDYYTVTASDVGESSGNFPNEKDKDNNGADNGTGVHGMGLVVGVNAGTITNLTINYTAMDGAMQPATTDGSGDMADSKSLDSAQDPDNPYAYGIVTGVNIGTINNVYVNQQAIFNGNTKARNDGSGLWNPATPYRNFSAVGGVAGVNMGYGNITNCYVFLGNDLWAQADGSVSGGSSSARFSSAFAGGLVGLIRGDNAQLTYSYVDGDGGINAWAMRGRTKVALTYEANKAWSLAYAGGVTAGKIVFYVEDNNYYGVARPMGANQVKGIISNWTGTRRDSYGNTSYLGKEGIGTSKRTAKGMPFDMLYSADQGTDKQDMIIFPFNYKATTNSSTLDMSHEGLDKAPNEESEVQNFSLPAKMYGNWVDVYSWKHGSYDESEVSLTFEGNYLRVQAKSDIFMNTQESSLEDVTRAQYPNGYSLKYDNTYRGNFVWSMDIYTLGKNIDPETQISSANAIKPTDQTGSFVRYYSSNMSKGSYVVKFGATYAYSIQNNSTTSKQYNNKPITADMMPKLILQNKDNSTFEVFESGGKYKWNIVAASTGQSIVREQSIYPDTYYMQPYAIVDEEMNSGYAYYDETQRTLAVSDSTERSMVVVSKATLSLRYDYADTWVSAAEINVSMTSNGVTPSSKMISAYSYQGGTMSGIVDLENVNANNSFSFIESVSTPKNGRTIYNVTAYVKKDDGSYVAVADTSRASASEKTVTVKIDATAPVLSGETYYTVSEILSKAQLGEDATLEAMYDAWKADPSKFTALSADEVKSGRWYNEDILVFVESSDEDRSGINTVSVSEAVNSTDSGIVVDQSRYHNVISGGSSVTVVRVSGVPYVKITLTDNNFNTVTIGLNDGGRINVDKTSISINDLKTVYLDYSLAEDKAYTKLQISFNATFGGAGLYMWYYIDNNTLLEDGDGIDKIPADAEWKLYDFGRAVNSGSDVDTFIPENMEKAALFVKFTSAVEGYEVAEPVIFRIHADPGGLGDMYKFTIDLNGANIAINARYLEIYDSTSDTAYRLDNLVNNQYTGVNLASLFTKSYDGTLNLKPTLEFRFTSDVNEQTELRSNVHYTGIFNAATYQSSFRITWLKLVAEYSDMNASDNVKLNLSIVTDDEVSPISMNVSVDYGNNNVQQVMAIGTRITKSNMAFDINQIFTEGTDITMSAGSVDTSSGSAVFKWTYGDLFDGLVVKIANDASGGEFYFRFKSMGLEQGSAHMNVGGSYTAYVDAIKIDSPVYQMDDFAELVKNGETYEGDAGANYSVSITGTIPIEVQKKEVRVTFALDEVVRFSYSIPYDGLGHKMTAAYTDVDGVVQYAKIVWYEGDQVKTYNEVKEIGSYTAKAVIEDNNYKIKGQSQQSISIIATYLDVLVPDKTAQYNDGGTVSYIPDLPEDSPAKGKNIVYTIIYYQKLGNSLKLLGENYPVTEVGEYYVKVSFDPEKQTDPDLKKFAAKNYEKADATYGAGSIDNYISFNVVKADTKISGVENQISTYNKMDQIIDFSDAEVKSASKGNDVAGNVRLQYWDADQEQYVDYDSTAANGKYRNEGTYSYRLVYDGNENYNACELLLTLTINAAKITGVTFGGDVGEEGILGVKKVYDGKALSLEATVAADSNIVGEDAKIEYSRMEIGGYSENTPEFTIVGRHQIWMRITCDNFESVETTAYVIITTAPHPDDAITFTGGQIRTFEYDGKEHSIEYTLNTEKYGTGISVTASNIEKTDAGEYVGSILVVMANYASGEYETTLTITPKKISEVDTSSLNKIQQEQGFTSDTDLTEIEITFVGVNGTERAELTFWDENDNIVIPDAYGCLPAGTYTITYDAGDNYDLSEVGEITLTLAQGSGERPDHEHVDSNGDGVCDECGEQIGEEGGEESCDHVDADNDGKCDKCGASMSSKPTEPKETPNAVVYVVIAVCAVLVVAAIAGVIVAAVVKSRKKKNNNRYNII